MRKFFKTLLLLSLTALFLFGCSEAPANSGATPSESAQPSSQGTEPVNTEEVTIVVAAAASLEKAYTESLIPLFSEKYPNIRIEGVYDSSGKLQTQIESGLEADVFMSAATAQMDALTTSGLIQIESVIKLLENRLVLIKPTGSQTAVTGFENATDAAIIAIGDPESVPAGQYAKEAFTSLGNWEAVLAKASLGTNVTEVLNWVVEASAEVGVVYETDAKSADVEVIAYAPEGSLKQKVIYPVGIIAASKSPEETKLFTEFLQSEEAAKVFESYGFTINA